MDPIEAVVEAVAAADPDPRLAPVVRAVAAGLHSAGSRRSYSADLRELARYLAARGRRVLDADRDDLAAYAAALEARGLAPDSRRRRIAVARVCYREAIDRGLTPAPNPAGRLRVAERPPVQPPALTVEELSAVLLAAGTGLDSGDPWRALRGARTHLLVALAAYTGLRVSELCGLRRGVVGRAGERHVLKDVAGKGGTRSRVVIPPALHAEIEAFGRRLEAMVGPLGPDEPLLPALGRRPQPGRAVLAPLSPRRARDLVDGALAAAGRDERRTGPHLLRATAITMVYLGSHDAFLAQRFARHARADTTARYIRAADELSETGSDYLAVDDPLADALT